MGFDSEGLATALTLNFTVSPLLVLVAWVFLRKRSIMRIEMWRIYRSERPKDPPTFFNFSGCGGRKSSFIDVIRGNDPWVDETQGPEVAMYLKFLGHCVILFALVGFFCGVVLIPVNATSSYRSDYFKKQQELDPDKEIHWSPGVADWTTRNLSPKSDRLWGLFVVSLIVAAETYAMAYSLLASMRKIKVLQQNTTKTARIKDCHTEDDARAKIPRAYHDSITAISVPRCAVPGMIDSIAELESIKYLLEKSYAYKEQNGNDLMIYTPVSCIPSFLSNIFSCCRKKINSQDYYWSKYNETVRKLATMSAKVNNQPVIGEAFVTFDSAVVCCKVIAEVSRSDLKEKILQSVWFAPPGSLIIWKNLGQHPAMKIIRGLITFLCMFLLTVCWASIIAFLGSADKLSAWIPGLMSLMDSSNEVKGALTAYLPVVIVAILNVLLPLIMRYWTEHVELVSDKIQREHRLLRKMFIFSVFSTILLQAALQGFGNSAQLIQHASTADVVYMFVSMISPSNGYFVVFVVQAAFMGNLFRVLRPGELFTCPVIATGALTAHEHRIAYEKAPFQYSEEYGYALMVFAFAMIFSVNAPLIPIFAFFFFLIKLIVDRSQLTDGYPRCRPTDLRLVPCVVQCILGCLTVMQIFGVCILSAIKMRWDVYYCSFVPIAVSIFVHVHTFRQSRHIMGPGLLNEIVEGTALEKSAFPGLSGIVKKLIYGKQSIQENLHLNTAVTHQLVRSDDEEDNNYGGGDEYVHPCSSFLIDDVIITKEYMESKSWFVTRSEANQEASSYGITPNLPLPSSIIPGSRLREDSPDPDDVHIVAT